jgi:isopenicillin N synthase-like dioxygenase
VTQNVPVVDIAALARTGDAEGRALIVQTIAAAAHDWGFFQVVNHGVPADLIQRVWSETHRFFALPRNIKLEITRTKENPRGYYDRELTKNKRDLKEVFDFAGVLHPELPEDHPDNRAAVDGTNQWPDALPSFRETLLQYFRACEGLGLKLLGSLCAGLGVEENTLRSNFTPIDTSFVRLNYYPLADPLEPEAAATTTDLGDMALHHHTDAGALTILLQDQVGGLQVFANDTWSDVEPVEGALVINVGDMMQIWSNDRFQAALHRVRPITDQPRYSIPFFFNPSYETDCAPLVATAGDQPRYRTVNWGAFRQARTDGDYGDFGKEIQIEDFRIR